MTRRMTITVVNTGIDEKWVLSKSHLEHGKWMAGSPPSSIGPNDKEEVRSEKTTGASYGTTGWIQFTSTKKPGSTMTITWNKPYGHDATTCTVDMNSVDYTAEVKNKDFQQSEAWCDVVISMHTTDVIDTKNWMSKLAGSTTLNNISMPGSHDAGMSELHHCSIGANDANTQTQQLNIQGQLEAGSRYFDIRVDYDHGELVTYHRASEDWGIKSPWGCNGQTLKAVLDELTAFLSAHKTEVAILKFSHIRFSNEGTMEKIEAMLKTYGTYLYKGSDTNLAQLKISDVAGKFIAVLDFETGVDPTQGFFRYHDGFVDDVCAYRGLNMTVCDKYANTDTYTKMEADQLDKWDKYGKTGQNYLFLLSWTLTAGSSGSIRTLAKQANDHLPQVLRKQITDLKKPLPNIVYIDFVNVETCRSIISHNFK
jgi:1-phosphatidylinositol phosphodiesterase